jgi:hypothetical protein
MMYLFFFIIIPFQQICSQERIPLFIPYLTDTEVSLKSKPSRKGEFHRIEHTKIIFTYDKDGLTLEYHNFDKHNYMLSQTIYDKDNNTWYLISLSECEYGDCY